MESKLKAECMDQSGELYENLLLREFGYPHLPNPVFVPEPKTKQAIVGLLENKSDAWNDAGTKPRKACFCETYHHWDESKWVQFWNGKHWCAIGMSIHEATAKKNMKSHYQYPQWREVQP